MVLAVKYSLTNSDGFPRSYTCTSNVEILKNKVLTLSDPNTAAEVSAASVATGYVCAGISSMDKDSTDATTKISAYTDGIFKVYASGSITAGQPIKSVGTGYFMAAVAADVASGVICGKSLETASGGETFLAYIKV